MILDAQKTNKVFPLYYSVPLLVICLTALMIFVFVFNIERPVLLQPTPQNAVNITTCGVLSLNDTYYALTANLTSMGATCLIIEGYNSTIDGTGLYSLVGDNAINFSGIEVRGNGNAIQRFNISGFYNGIFVNSANSTTVVLNSINGSDNIGINITQTTNVSAITNFVSYSSYSGIFSKNSLSGLISGNEIQGRNTPSLISSGIALDGSSNYLVQKNKVNLYFFSSGLIFASNNNFANNIFENPFSAGLFSYYSGPNNFLNDSIKNSGQSAVYSDNSVGLNFTKLSVKSTASNFYDIHSNNQFGGITLTDTYLARYNFNNTAIRFVNTGNGRIQFYPNVTASNSNLSSDVKLAFNFAEVNSVNSPGLNRSALVVFEGISGNLNNATIFRNGVPCPLSVCVNLTALNGATVLFNVTGWTNYTISSQIPSSPFINIEEPDSNEAYTLGSFPLRFVVELSQNGTAWFTLNNGTTNVTMNSSDMITYSYNQTSLNLGNYTMLVYANFTSSSFIANSSVRFRVLSNPITVGPPLINNSNNTGQNNAPIVPSVNNGSTIVPLLNGSSSNQNDSSIDMRYVAYWMIISVLSIAIVILIFLVIKAIQAREINKNTIPGSIVSQLR